MQNLSSTKGRKRSNTSTYQRRTAGRSGSSKAGRPALPDNKKEKTLNRVKTKADDTQNIIIAGIVLGIINLIFFLCMVGVISGGVGIGVKQFLLGLFGILAYVMPFIFFGGGLFIFAKKDNYMPYLKTTVISVLLLFAVGGFFTLCSRSDIVYASQNPGALKFLYDLKSGGGCILGLLGLLLCMFFGKVGSIIIDLVLIIGLIILLNPEKAVSLIKLTGSKLNFLDDYDDSYDDEDDEDAGRRRKDIQLPALNDDGQQLNLLEIADERREKRELERIEKQKQIEEAKEKKQKKLEEKKLKEDRADDDRIVNASRKRNDFAVNGGEHFESSLVSDKGTMVRSKDDVHEITLLTPVPESENEEKTDKTVNKDIETAPVTTVKKTGDMREITVNVSDDVKEVTENKTEIKKEELKLQQINITRYGDDTVTDDNVPDDTPDDKTDDNPETVHVSKQENDPEESHDVKPEKIIKYEAYTPSDDDIVSPKENKGDGLVDINKKQYEKDGSTHVTEFNNSAAPIPESVKNGITLKAGETNPLIDSMPDPVTEKTHQAESNALAKEIENKPKKKVPRNKYKKPPISLLNENKNKKGGDEDKTLKENAFRLQEVLKNFGVDATVQDICQGPSVTRYELKLADGVKVSKITNLADDIKLNMAAVDVRIEAPIPGKAAVGIEIPNATASPVLIRDIMESPEFKAADSNISFGVGKDISGKTIIGDIAKMPHMLIAGATGAGKSVCINTLIMGILYKAHPDDVKLIMIDPKVVELSVYNGIPHLLLPVVTDPKKASASLQWAVNEMTNRYNKFAEAQVRDLKGFNKYVEDNKDVPDIPEKMPQIVVIVDELADLMMVASKEVEESICRLAQLARAAGIHLIIATQRPSVDVITGLIKANMPSRVAFRVSSGIDSRTILDTTGAERLIGKGDMLFFPQGYTKPLRVQGAFVSDDEVKNVVEFLKNNNEYDSSSDAESEIASIAKGTPSGSNSKADDGGSDVDEYFKEASRFVVEKGSASSGMLQRMYRIGFNRAARMIDQMQEYGIVSGEQGTKPRNVLVSKEQLEEILKDL